MEIRRPHSSNGARLQSRKSSNSSMMMHKLYGYDHFNTKLHTTANAFVHCKEIKFKQFDDEDNHTFITHLNLRKKPDNIESDYTTINNYVRELDLMSLKKKEEYDVIKEIRKRLYKTRKNLKAHKTTVERILNASHTRYIIPMPTFKVRRCDNATPISIMNQLLCIQGRMNTSTINIESQLKKYYPLYSRIPSKLSSPYSMKNTISRPHTTMGSKRGSAYKL